VSVTLRGVRYSILCCGSTRNAAVSDAVSLHGAAQEASTGVHGGATLVDVRDEQVQQEQGAAAADVIVVHRAAEATKTQT
jgi:hypothetical protein